jgi:hypothetical protein
VSINWRVLRDLEWTDDLLRILIRIFPVVAIVGFMIKTAYVFLDDAPRHFDSASSIEQQEVLRNQIQKAQSQIVVLETAVQRSNDALAQVLSGMKSQTDAPTSDKDIALLHGEISSLKSDLTTTRSNVDALDAALLNTPDKALSIPLLRKDLEDFRLANQRDVDSIRLEMGRAYELNKWLMGFLLAAVLGMIVNNLIQAKTAGRAQPAKEE